LGAKLVDNSDECAGGRYSARELELIQNVPDGHREEHITSHVVGDAQFGCIRHLTLIEMARNGGHRPHCRIAVISSCVDSPSCGGRCDGRRKTQPTLKSVTREHERADRPKALSAANCRPEHWLIETR